MKEIIGNCGLICTGCPAYLATRSDDDVIRQSTASHWSKIYQVEIKPEDINCNGCLSREGVHFNHCLVCKIIVCCQERNLKHCAFCNEQPCEKLVNFHSKVPEAKAGFERYLSENNQWINIDKSF